MSEFLERLRADNEPTRTALAMADAIRQHVLAVLDDDPGDNDREVLSLLREAERHADVAVPDAAQPHGGAVMTNEKTARVLKSAARWLQRRARKKVGCGHESCVSRGHRSRESADRPSRRRNERGCIYRHKGRPTYWIKYKSAGQWQYESSGHKTASVYRRYAIADARDLRVAVERLDAMAAR
jgi:hypothetical protein